jgi:DNA repair protein RadC
MKKINWNTLSEPVGTMYEKGKSAMTDSQLLSIIIQVDTGLAQKILVDAEHQLSNLAKWTFRDWMNYEGIGPAKAAAIVASLEIGRRRRIQEPQKKPIISSSADAYLYVKPFLLDEVVEHFYILLLNRRNEVIRHVHISTGGTSGTVADPKLIFKHALDHLANSIILVHNHPSGNTRPSEQDRRLTTRLKDIGTNLEVSVLDHIIFTEVAYFSFADEGLI